MQFFTTDFTHNNPTTKFQTQIYSPSSLYLMKHDENEFIIEPKHDHTLQGDRIRIGSFYKSLLKLTHNSKVSLISYKYEIEDADVVIVKGKFSPSVSKILKEIKYIKLGLQLNDIKIIKINDFSLENEEMKEDNKFYKFTNKTRICFGNEEITLYGLEKQEKKFEELIFAPLLKRMELKKFGMNVNTLFLLEGDKGMKMDIFLKKICQNMNLNRFEYDFIKNDGSIPHFNNAMKLVNDIKPSLVVFKNYITKDIGFIHEIENYCENIRNEESEYGTILIFLTDIKDQTEFITKRFNIDIIFKLENPGSDDRQRIIENILKKIPNTISKEEIHEICEYLNFKTIKEIESVFGKAIEKKIYEIEKRKKDKKNYKTKNNFKNKNDKCFDEKINSNYDTTDDSSFYSQFIKKDINISEITESLNKINIKDQNQEFLICFDDLKFLLDKKIMRPNNDEICAKTNIFFKDIGGYEDVKKILTETVIWPLLHKQKFMDLNIKTTKGILFYGPPGCSKTLLAKAISNESKMSFISVKGSELENKYVGETGKSIRNLFDKARSNAPCIIFIDEIDSISGKFNENTNDYHSKTIAAFLTEMDGMEEAGDVIIMGATNRIESIDPAFMRPGRIDKIIHIDLPNIEARKKIYMIKLKGCSIEEIDFDVLAEKSEKMSGAEITLVCREALMIVLREKIENNIDMKLSTIILLDALKKIKKMKVI